MNYQVASPDELPAVAADMLRVCKEQRIFALQGGLGAGKTTLVKALCAALGTGDVVKSPTFALVNSYQAPIGEIYHFDFYRIRNLEEVYDLGFEEYFDSGNYCFIEWPEMIGPLLPEDAAEVAIESTGETTRTIILRCKKEA